MLEEQRSDTISQANLELNLQETIAEHAVRSLKQQLHQQNLELANRSQDCETSRHEQLQLLAELRSREQARRATLTRIPQELEELARARSRKMMGIIWRHK